MVFKSSATNITDAILAAIFNILLCLAINEILVFERMNLPGEGTYG